MLSITRGSDWSAELAWTDEADAAQDATGYTITCELRWILSHEVIMPVTASWSNAATGMALISMTEAETAQVPIGMLSELKCTVVSTGGDTKVFTGGEVIGVA